MKNRPGMINGNPEDLAGLDWQRAGSQTKSLTYLDTHVAVWLCSGDVPFSAAALKQIESAELRMSPMVLFEMQILHEIGRLNAAPR
jgi:hypothetical protein